MYCKYLLKNFDPPMEDVDTQELNDHDEETMFLSDVIGEEYDLLFLDSYLRDTFRGRRVRQCGTEVLAKEGTI